MLELKTQEELEAMSKAEKIDYLIDMLEELGMIIVKDE